MDQVSSKTTTTTGSKGGSGGSSGGDKPSSTSTSAGSRARKSQVKSSLTTMTTTTTTTMTKSSSKKERWLLTRKTWRYMTDAVGNLLPADNKNPASANTNPSNISANIRNSAGTGTSTGQTTSANISGGSVVVSSGNVFGVSGGRIHTRRTRSSNITSTGTQSTSTSTGTEFGLTMSPMSGGGGGASASASGGYMMAQYHQSGQESSSSAESAALVLKMGEQNFHRACNSQSNFLIWTPSAPQKPSGPALRQMKQQQQQQAGAGQPGKERKVRRRAPGVEEEEEFDDYGEKLSIEGYFSEGEDPEDPDLLDDVEGDVEEDVDEDEEQRLEESEMEGDEYDQYGDEDGGVETENENEIEEEQVTVREGRKSSLASSISSVISGLHFFRPSSSSAASTAGLIIIPGGAASDNLKEKTFVSVGIQTEPFPEETLNRLRRQCFLQDNLPPPPPDSPGPGQAASSSPSHSSAHSAYTNWKFPPSSSSSIHHLVKSDEAGMSAGSSESGISHHGGHHGLGLQEDNAPMTPTTILDILPSMDSRDTELGTYVQDNSSRGHGHYGKNMSFSSGGSPYSVGMAPVRESAGEMINNNNNSGLIPVPVASISASYTIPFSSSSASNHHHRPMDSSASSFVSGSSTSGVPHSSTPSSSFFGSPSSVDTPASVTASLGLTSSTPSSISSGAIISSTSNTTLANVPPGRTSVSSTSTTATTATSATSVPIGDNTDKKSEESGYSSSISDTVMRYLRMVRKSSKVDKSDMDRFKTVNYDKSLRNIKSKNVSIEEALDYEKNKAAAAAAALNASSHTVIPEDSNANANNANATVSSSVSGAGVGVGVTATTPQNTSSSVKTGSQNQTSSTGANTIINPTSPDSTPMTPSSEEKFQDEGIVSRTGATSPVTPPATGNTAPGTKSEEQKSSKGKKDKDKDKEGKIPGRILPSVGIQAGESLVRFLKLFNRRKTSDFSNASNAPSYCSTESPVDITSPRYSLATTVISSSGSDADFSQQQQQHQHFLQLQAQHQQQQQQQIYHHTKSLQFQPNPQFGGEGDMVQTPGEMHAGFNYAMMSPRASMSTDPDGPFDEVGSGEFDDVFTYSNINPNVNPNQNVPPSSSYSKNPAFFQQFSSPHANPSYHQPQFRPAGQGPGSNNNNYYPHQMPMSMGSRALNQLGSGGGVGSDSYSGYHSSSSAFQGHGSSPNNNNSSNNSGSGQIKSHHTSRDNRGQSSAHHQHHNYPHPSSSSSTSYKTSGNIPSSQQQQMQHPGNNPYESAYTSSSSSQYGQPGYERESRSARNVLGGGSSNSSSNNNNNNENLDNFQCGGAGGSSNLFSSSSSGRTSGKSAGNQNQNQNQSHQQQQGQQQQTFIKSLFSSSRSKNCERGAESRLSSGSNSSKNEQRRQQSGSGGGGGNNNASSSVLGTDSSFGSRLGILGSRNNSNTNNTNNNNSSNSNNNNTNSSNSRNVKEKDKENILMGESNPQTFHDISSSFMPSTCNPVMQKSKSSSSVLQQQSQSNQGPTSSTSSRLNLSKPKLFKSKKQIQLQQQQQQQQQQVQQQQQSQAKTQSTWTPQGKTGQWISLLTGSTVSLEGTSIHQLSEVERLAFQKVALVKLQSMNLGVDVKIPRVRVEKIAVSGGKPKRRPYLLKKKALSTGFFDSKTKEESGAKEGASGLVFAIPLSQCVKNDQERRLQAIIAAGAADSQSDSQLQPTSPPWDHSRRKPSHHSSRLSVSSDLVTKDDKGGSGSNESLFWCEKTTNKSGSYSQYDGSNNDISESDICNYGQVPKLVVSCVKHLETYGLHTTGIFRVSSSLKRIRQLREEIDSGKDIVFGEEHSPHDVAALLKEFLRDLPEPLLCRDLYEPFLRTQRIRNRKQQLESMQSLIGLLPVANRDTLHALLALFAKVVDNCMDTRTKTGELITGNKMEAYSLATLIAPNILPCIPVDGGGGLTMTGAAAGGGAGNLGSGEQHAILTKERRDSIDVVNYMITNYKELFSVPSETLNQIYMELLETNPEAVEQILRAKFPGASQEPDDVETSSVFEGGGGSEHGDDYPTSRLLLRKREDILHEGWGKGGGTTPEVSGGRMKIEQTIGSSREKIGDSGDVSDSSSTKSTSRWFRKSRSGEQKNRASSDSSGSEKVKGSRKKKASIVGMGECKRASSLDSVNLKDIAGRQKISISNINSGSSSSAGASGGVGNSSTNSYSISNSSSPNSNTVRLIESTTTTTSNISGPGNGANDRQRSSSDQGLKIPLDLNRRQSCSPLLESSRSSGGDAGNAGGVIRASLKITMPLNMDDTEYSDIPFIDSSRDRGEEECSSPLDDSLSTFPYQEIQFGRICLGGLPVSSGKGGKEGGGGGSSPSAKHVNTTTKTISSHNEDGNSPKQSSHKQHYQQPTPQISSPTQHSASSSSVTLLNPTSHALSVHVTGENKGGGGGASSTLGLRQNVSGLGLIKSKTADFEKLLMVKKTVPSTILTPKVRIRGSIPSTPQQQQQQQPQEPSTPSSSSSAASSRDKERDRELFFATRSSDGLDTPTPATTERGKVRERSRVRDSSDLPTSSSGASLSGGRWKRSEIIASPSSKNLKRNSKPEFLP